jgi:hypothetical protein
MAGGHVVTIVDLLRADPWTTLRGVGWVVAPLLGILATVGAFLVGAARVGVWFAAVTALQAADVIAETWFAAPPGVVSGLRVGVCVVTVAAFIVFVRRLRQARARFAVWRQANQDRERELFLARWQDGAPGS